MTASKMTSADYPEGYWERAEGSNYTNYGDDPGWALVVDVISRYVRPPAVLYEVASAKGYFVLAASRRGYDARGIEISEYAVSKVPDEVKGQVVQGNAVDLPWADETADVVVSHEFMEHVYEDEVKRVISEKMRVLKPGGLMVMKIGIAEFEGPDFSPDHDHTHYNLQPRWWWEATFHGWGLDQCKDIEKELDDTFPTRDWCGRFFVFQKAMPEADVSGWGL